MERAESSTPLKKLRIARGLTQKQLAGAIGIDQSTLSLIENGNGGHPDTAKKIADYMGSAITPMHILYPENYPDYVVSGTA